MPYVSPHTFRVTRREWLGFDPSPGHSPLPGHATWHEPPGEWRVTMPDAEHFVRLATALDCHLTVMPNLTPEALPLIVVDPLPSVRDLLAPQPTTRARRR